MKVLMISRPTLFKVQGGDTVQIVETANALRKRGVEVEIKLADENIDYSSFDLIHFFNIIRPNNIIPHILKSKLPYVVSTIFVDYTEVEKRYRGKLAKLLFFLTGTDGIEYFKTIARFFMSSDKLVDKKYLIRGHRKSIEKVLNNAVLLLPNSESEYKRLKKRYNFKTKYHVVPNGVDEAFLENGAEIENRVGVICVARIEPIKNQLNLIKSLKNTDIPLKIIGKPSPNRQEYYKSCLAEATENISFLGHLEKDGILKEYEKARVHVLPSWFETTGLSSLEAAAKKCGIVLTAKGDTKEYFNELALYCDPEKPESIKAAIEKALTEEPSKLLRDRIAEKYTWDMAAIKTLKAYSQVEQLSVNKISQER